MRRVPCREDSAPVGRQTGPMTSRVVTVRGPVEPTTLGRTSIHEHVTSFLDHVAFDPVDSDVGRELAEAPITLENRWFVSQRFTAMRDNLRLDDEAVAIAEAQRFVAAGGGCIVDPTTDGFGRDPAALLRISRAADLHIVMGAGYYIHPAHPDWLESADEKAIAARIEADLTEGPDMDGVRAGFIGEVGCSWPLTDRERKSLRAAGRAQRATGAAVLVHPGRDPSAPAQIVGELEAVGADLQRVAIAHIERTHKTSCRDWATRAFRSLTRVRAKSSVASCKRRRAWVRPRSVLGISPARCRRPGTRPSTKTAASEVLTSCGRTSRRSA